MSSSIVRTLTLVSQLGLSVVVPAFMCIVLGNWLEEKTSLPLLIPFLILGILAGVRNAYVLLKTEIDRQKKEGR